MPTPPPSSATATSSSAACSRPTRWRWGNRVIATDPAIQGSRLKLADAAGGSTELALWNHPGEDVFGMIARCGRSAAPSGYWAARSTTTTAS